MSAVLNPSVAIPATLIGETLVGGDPLDPALISTPTDGILLLSHHPPPTDLTKGNLAFDIPIHPLRRRSRQSVFNPYDIDDDLSEEEDGGYGLVPVNSRSSQDSVSTKDRTPVALARAVSRLRKDPMWPQIKESREEGFTEQEKENSEQARNEEGKEREEKTTHEPADWPEVRGSTFQLYPGVLDPEQSMTQPEYEFKPPANTTTDSYHGKEKKEEQPTATNKGKSEEEKEEEEEEEPVLGPLDKGKGKELDTFPECNPAPSYPSEKPSAPTFERGIGPAPGEEGNSSKRKKVPKTNSFFQFFGIGSKSRGTKKKTKSPTVVEKKVHPAAEEKTPIETQDDYWSQKSTADLRTIYKAKRLALREARAQLASLRSNVRTLEESIESIEVEMVSRDVQVPVDPELVRRVSSQRSKLVISSK